MRRNILIIFLMIGLNYSCSSDNDNFVEPTVENSENSEDDDNVEDDTADMTEEDNTEDTNSEEEDTMEDDTMEDDAMEEAVNAIVGVWDLTGIDFDDTDASITTILLVGLLEDLISDGCETIVLSFNEDFTLDIERKDFTEALSGNLSVSCPEETIIDSTTWEINENDLTLTFEDGTTRAFVVEVDGDTAIVDGSVVNLLGDGVPEDEIGETSVIFTRR